MNRSKGGAAIRIADFIAFVADRATEQILKSFVLENAMPHVHIAVGNIDDAIAYLSRIERSPLFLLVDLHGSAMPFVRPRPALRSLRTVGPGRGTWRAQRRRPVSQSSEAGRPRLSGQAADGRTPQANGQRVGREGRAGHVGAGRKDHRFHRDTRRRGCDHARPESRTAIWPRRPTGGWPMSISICTVAPPTACSAFRAITD